MNQRNAVNDYLNELHSDSLAEVDIPWNERCSHFKTPHCTLASSQGPEPRFVRWYYYPKPGSLIKVSSRFKILCFWLMGLRKGIFLSSFIPCYFWGSRRVHCHRYIVSFFRYLAWFWTIPIKKTKPLSESLALWDLLVKYWNSSHIPYFIVVENSTNKIIWL